MELPAFLIACLSLLASGQEALGTGGPLGNDSQTWRGRVVDARGQAAHPASVGLFDPDTRKILRQARTKPDGSFELSLKREGTFRLRAWSSGRGIGETTLSTGTEGAPQDVVIQVAGRTAASGVLVDPEGAPIPSFPLTIASADLTKAPRDSDRWANELPGLSFDRTTTDLEGRFRFEGLGLETFVFAAWQGRLEERIAGVFEPGDNLRVVYDLHRLEVELVDHAGVPVTLQTGGPLLASWSQLTDWRLKLNGYAPPARRPRPVDAPPNWIVGPGRVAFPVDEGRSHVLCYFDATIPLFETRVFVPHDRHRTTVRIQLPPPAEPGTLRVVPRRARRRRTGSRLPARRGGPCS